MGMDISFLTGAYCSYSWHCKVRVPLPKEIGPLW
jgi:hypothetical protein